MTAFEPTPISRIAYLNPTGRPHMVLVAALALSGKVAYDAWVRFDQRRGVAGAFVGEIGAYVEIILGMNVEANLTAWTNISCGEASDYPKSNSSAADRTPSS